MNRINCSILISKVISSIEEQIKETVTYRIENGIVYVDMVDGSFVDFTVPKHNKTDQQRYDSVTVTGSNRLVDNED